MSHRTVLFLCTGNYYRSRFAELLFNALAAERGLPWRADSRGLALERGILNVGPIARTVLDALRARGLEVPAPQRFPAPVADADFARSHLVVALKESEHRPLMRERHPAREAHIEYWHVHDVDCGSVPEALAAIEANVIALLDRLARAEEPPEERCA